MLRLLGRLMVLFPASDYSALSCGEWVTCLHFQRLHKYLGTYLGTLCNRLMRTPGNYGNHIDGVPSMPPHNLRLNFKEMKQKYFQRYLEFVD